MTVRGQARSEAVGSGPKVRIDCAMRIAWMPTRRSPCPAGLLARRRLPSYAHRHTSRKQETSPCTPLTGGSCSPYVLRHGTPQHPAGYPMRPSGSGRNGSALRAVAGLRANTTDALRELTSKRDLAAELDPEPPRSGRLCTSDGGALSRDTPMPAIELGCRASGATANSLEGVPHTLLDRCRVIRFPAPGTEHVPALACSILRRLVVERGLNPRWIQPLDGIEFAALSWIWQDGSIRTLARLVQVVASAQEHCDVLH